MSYNIRRKKTSRLRNKLSKKNAKAVIKINKHDKKPNQSGSDYLNAYRAFNVIYIYRYPLLRDHYFMLVMQVNCSINYIAHTLTPISRKQHAGNLRWAGAFFRATLSSSS